MARVRKTQQGARMFFREDARREGAMPSAEYSKRDSIAFIEYCDECMEKHGLQHGRLARQIGLCNICGKDGFIFGRLERSDNALYNILPSCKALPCEYCGNIIDDEELIIYFKGSGIMVFVHEDCFKKQSANVEELC